MSTANFTRVLSSVNLSKSQIVVLQRLANGEILYCNWNSGRGLWVPNPINGGKEQSENKSTIDALLDRDLIETDGFRYRNDLAWLIIEITPAGHEALRGAK